MNKLRAQRERKPVSAKDAMVTQRTRRHTSYNGVIASLRAPFASFALKTSLLYCFTASLALADMQAPPPMLPDASNALLPSARTNLGIGTGTLPFGIRDDSAATPAAGGTGNAVGDQLTLNDGCSTHGVLTVATVSSGAVATYNIVKRGSCASVPTNPVGVSSTTGTGAGATFTLNYGPLVAGILHGSLTQNLGNLFIGGTGTTPDVSLYGGEDVALGDYAGGGLKSGAQFSTAVGHNSCGIGGTGTTGASNSCFGTDAGRNIASGAARNTIIGTGAAQNVSGTDNFVLAAGGGNTTALVGGIQNTLIHGGATLATGNGNLVGGFKADVTGSAVSDAVILGGAANGGGNGARGGTDSVVIGGRAGNASLTGSGVYIGRSAAGSNCTSGTLNIIIGNSIDCGSAGQSNFLNIGGLVQGDTSKKHFVLNGTAPTPTAGATDCGTSPTVAMCRPSTTNPATRPGWNRGCGCSSVRIAGAPSARSSVSAMPLTV